MRRRGKGERALKLLSWQKVESDVALRSMQTSIKMSSVVWTKKKIQITF